MQTQNPNNMIQIYCTRCGKKLAPDGKCHYCQIAKKQPRRQPIAKAVYDFCESPLTLVLAFFWTLSGILSVIFGLRTPILSFPIDISVILMVIGLWMLHACHSGGKRTSMGMASASLVIALILTSLTLILAILLGFFGIFISVSTSGHESMLLPFTIAAVTLLVLLPLVSLYLVRLGQIFRSARGVLRNSMDDADTPLYTVVCSILLGLGYLILAVKAGTIDTVYTSMLSTLSEVLPSGSGSLIGMLNSLSWQWIRPQLIACAISAFYTAAVLIVYRRRIAAARKSVGTESTANQPSAE